MTVRSFRIIEGRPRRRRYTYTSSTRRRFIVVDVDDDSVLLRTDDRARAERKASGRKHYRVAERKSR